MTQRTPGMHIKYCTGVKPVEHNHSVYKLDDKDHIENMLKKRILTGSLRHELFLKLEKNIQEFGEHIVSVLLQYKYGRRTLASSALEEICLDIQCNLAKKMHSYFAGFNWNLFDNSCARILEFATL